MENSLNKPDFVLIFTGIFLVVVVDTTDRAAILIVLIEGISAKRAGR